MSKRVADGQGGSERYGGMEDPRDAAMDPPRKATAAQLAKRNIKPLKGRPGASRSASPSKASPSPGFPNPFGGADSNPFAQSAPAPPAAASFNFGQTTAQPQSNPFGNMSTSQSFPPNAPTNNSTFSFGQSQPSSAPTFAPPQASSFNFGASTPSGTSFSFGASPAKPSQNGDANKAPSFTFGSTPASPGPSAPASPAPAFNPFSSMSGPSFGSTEQPISAAEISEIEAAGPRLTQEGKLEQLANIVRQSDPKYKDASLAGLNLSTLPPAVQRKLLDFVRNKPETPEAPKSSFSFSSTAPAPTASTSFNFGASTASTPPASQPEAQSSPFKSFGATPAPASPAPTSGFKFGSTAELAKKDDTPATTSSFGGFGASKKDETPAKAPSTAFNFGSPAASPAPAPSTSFSFGASTAAPASPAPAFNFGAAAEKKDETPKPAASAFNFGASTTSAAPPSPKPAEKKLPSPSFSFGTPAASKPAEEVSYPSLSGASSQESSAAPKPSFSFGQTAAPAASSPFKPATTPAAVESPKPQNAGLGNSMFGNSPAQQKPAESAFKGFGASTPAPAQPSAPKPAFNFGSSVSAQTSVAPARSEPRASNALSAPTASGVATPPASPQLPPTEMESALLKQLNESLRTYLTSADASLDWSAVMRLYLEQAAEIRSDNSGAPSTASITSSSEPKLITAPLAASSTRGEKRVADEEVTKEDDHSKRAKQASTPSKPTFAQSTMNSASPDKPLSKTASLFSDILDKPETPKSTNVFSASADKTPAPPATAPQVKSNPFGAIARNVSATPAPSTQKTSFVPPATAQAPSSSNNGTSAPSPFQIPKFGSGSTSSTAPTSGFQVPKFGGGSSTTTTPSFLGSFGAKAAEQEAKEREKRKEEDMDSDEDEEEWERKDAEKQAQKKAELLAASQSLKFSFDTSKKPTSSASAVFSFSGAPSNTSSSSNIFGNLSGSKPDDEDEDGDTDEDEDVHAALTNATPAKPTAGKSLFERVSFDADKEKTSDTPSASFKFSSFGSSGAADNTWKGSDGIKFGASTVTAGTTTPDGSPAKAPAPKFNFGAASQPAEKSSPFSGMAAAKPSPTGSVFDAAKPSAPTTGFSFGGAAPSTLAPPSGSSVFASAATSRATTPGATTTDAEGSAAESEPSDTPNDVQKDLTSLTADDIAKYDLIHEARCKVTKLVKSDDDKPATWVSQGVGPIRVLASKENSKPRILMRADPSGKVGLNFNALLNPALYMIKAPKMVQLSVPTEGKKVESFMCMFKDGDKAKEFLEKLHGAIAKAQG
ncbi:uncharacterized protein M437DRAFT_57268 [Aureobasidium melanogenum CBS 110374]|uniref:RanBD1 domain-containing protein n=1 Tax=Aureobasidium melanogenum (strain CBS 110374) TaxID=1043003 RepID=A0A074VNH0_AURM1|nr:uncharacterized protein M437DRAFT_57268 [Aureobasidium melanogenum CBS 110374]KEQ59232.1 hypothetical protein M437DRAFT_57268 [Aureobasidium melanogenum CBS 110374]